LSGIVLVRQPVQAPTRAIGEIEQHLTGSSLQPLFDIPFHSQIVELLAQWQYFQHQAQDAGTPRAPRRRFIVKCHLFFWTQPLHLTKRSSTHWK
jgi:hypothetical protein